MSRHFLGQYTRSEARPELKKDVQSDPPPRLRSISNLIFLSLKIESLLSEDLPQVPTLAIEELPPTSIFSSDRLLEDHTLDDAKNCLR
jgi:hypothetical protein